MADEIHPAQPLVPTTRVDVPADEKRRHKQNEQDDNHVEDNEKENKQPKRPPKTALLMNMCDISGDIS